MPVDVDVEFTDISVAEGPDVLESDRDSFETLETEDSW